MTQRLSSDLLMNITSTIVKFKYEDPNGLQNTSMKVISKCRKLKHLEMAFCFVQSTGLIQLSNLQELRVFIAAPNSLNTSFKSLTTFFKAMKNLIIVDINGASCINKEAIECLATNNKQLTQLYLNTYLLPGSVIQIVKDNCPIKILKFSPEIMINQ